MFTIKYQARIQFYFQKFTKHVKVAENRGLYRVAGYIRTATKRSMRLRTGASTPGKPPHAHVASNSGLRAIQFNVNSTTTQAIIGPVKFPGSNYFNEPATYIQEFGGVFTGSFRTRRKPARFPERSYMYSTVKRLAEQGKIAKEFAVSIAELMP